MRDFGDAGAGAENPAMQVGCSSPRVTWSAPQGPEHCLESAPAGALDTYAQGAKIVKNQQLRRDTLSKCDIATQNVY